MARRNSVCGPWMLHALLIIQRSVEEIHVHGISTIKGEHTQLVSDRLHLKPDVNNEVVASALLWSLQPDKCSCRPADAYYGLHDLAI